MIHSKTEQGSPKVTTPADDRFVAVNLNEWHHRGITLSQPLQDLTAPSGTMILRQSMYRRLVEKSPYAVSQEIPYMLYI
ncbi:hypothetical protein TNCV_1505131 [Trichonephila clavipes]|nr:hypothetical protein TNCV_1505131 [Trichonephila clavipes]